MVGDQAEAFRVAEAKASLSDKVVPIKPVPIMYVCMPYDDFRRRGLFVGSGVLGAGCRTVIGQRLKHSGMYWTVKGANSIIALRCNIMSNRWEDFWENRAAA
jgi:hypothetical protein